MWGGLSKFRSNNVATECSSVLTTTEEGKLANGLREEMESKEEYKLSNGSIGYQDFANS